MSKKNVYAHTRPGQPKEKWQHLAEHQQKTADKASGFAQCFGSSDWAWNAGVLHDLGKIDPRFQMKLCDKSGLEYEDETLSGSVNHSGAGAVYAEEKFGKLVGRTLAYLVMGHHAGLPDYMEDKSGNAALRIRLEKEKAYLDLIRDDIAPFVVGLKEPQFPSYVKSRNYHLWVRMLFSCLVDADWLDTERVMDPAKYDKRSAIEFPSIEELGQKFCNHMKRFAGKTGPLNEIRREILQACKDAAQQKPGLFTLTVPTGGGKTLSSMAFALEHAKKYGKDRIIYVIPYTSIIEQTAKTFGEVFGEGNVVEHHSNISGDDKDRLEMDMAAENWDAPIIVTTNVQFFESLYSAKPKRCRKLHNIANSVVLIDEAQLISPEHVTPCVDVINELTQSFGVSIVLCTATQPALPGLIAPCEIVHQPDQYYESLKRVEYHFPKDVNVPSTWDEIADKLKQHDEVLCIVNTRRDCRELYDLMIKDDPGAIHLSALMCGEHRSDVIKKIKARLDENRKLKEAGLSLKPLRVISTQLVEAGVDIDFPVIFRALAGLDSIVQAAGRCNREGKLILGHVYVFVPQESKLPALLRKGVDKTKEFFDDSDRTPDMQNPEVFTDYFDLYYQSLNDTGKKFVDQLKPSDRDGGVYFRTVGNEFQLIDDKYSSPVIVRYKKPKENECPEEIARYKKNMKLLERLEQEGPHKELMRELQRYTVNVRKDTVTEMCDRRMICFLKFRDKPTDILIQCTDCYSMEYGFDIMKRGLSCEEMIL